MSEILLPLGLAAVRLLIGLCEFCGALFEADFLLTNSFFSSKAFLALRNKVRHRRVS